MARVSAAEGIRYGIGLLGYSLGVSIFGLLISIVGVALLVQRSFVLGAILFLVGGVASYAGLAGTLYKVIADAVAKGNEIAGNPTAKKVAAQADASDGGESATATKVTSDDSATTATKIDDSG
jgi:hypothetical protein